MATGVTSKYSVELVNRDGELVADLSGRAQDRKIVQSRNEAEDITWSLDLNDFEKYSERLGVDPKTLLIPGQTEVRIKRYSDYLCGGQLLYTNTDPVKNEISLKATGFLNLLKDAYTDAERLFEAVAAGTIAWTAIDEWQDQGANYDFGIRQGTIQTIPNYTILYKRTSLKDLIQDFGDLKVNGFDHRFDYDKTFNVYQQLGSDRPETLFEYPGNVKAMNVPNDASGMANQIVVLGSGFGEDAQAQAIRDLSESQDSYKVRRKVITASNISDEDVLADRGDAELKARGLPNEIPSMTVDGNIAPFVTDYEVGDRVPVKVSNHKYLDHINRTYRIEKREISIDDQDNESVKLYLSVA